jgi:large-conductance mechanosensitive channel
MKIIKEILSRIFDTLNCQKEEKFLNENLTYWGYYKNIVNYLLIKNLFFLVKKFINFAKKKR